MKNMNQSRLHLMGQQWCQFELGLCKMGRPMHTEQSRITNYIFLASILTNQSLDQQQSVQSKLQSLNQSVCQWLSIVLKIGNNQMATVTHLKYSSNQLNPKGLCSMGTHQARIIQQVHICHYHSLQNEIELSNISALQDFFKFHLLLLVSLLNCCFWFK